MQSQSLIFYIKVDNIYKGLPGRESENHDIKFKYKEQTKSQTVYWIYKHQEDEQHHQNTHIQATKIFFVFDFPTILRSAMGTGTAQNWNEETRKGNISSFKRTLQCLSCSVGKTRYHILLHLKYSQMLKKKEFGDLIHNSFLFIVLGFLHEIFRSLSFLHYKADIEEERQPLSYLIRDLMRMSHEDRSGF